MRSNLEFSATSGPSVFDNPRATGATPGKLDRWTVVVFNEHPTKTSHRTGICLRPHGPKFRQTHRAKFSSSPQGARVLVGVERGHVSGGEAQR